MDGASWFLRPGKNYEKRYAAAARAKFLIWRKSHIQCYVQNYLLWFELITIFIVPQSRTEKEYVAADEWIYKFDEFITFKLNNNIETEVPRSELKVNSDNCHDVTKEAFASGSNSFLDCHAAYQHYSSYPGPHMLNQITRKL